MRLALIHDERTLRREHAALVRLCVALLDDGMHLVRLVPEAFDPFRDDDGERNLSLVPRIDYEPRVPFWQRAGRRARLLDALDKAPPDALLVVGDGAWPMAIDLATALESPLLVEVWSFHEAGRLARLRAARDGTIAACAVGLATVAEWLRARIDPALVHHVPLCVATTDRAALLPDSPTIDATRTGTPGAASPVGVRRAPWSAARRPLERAEPRPRLDETTGLAMAIIGEGDDVAAFAAALGAVRRLATELPELRVALEIRGRRGHDIWRVVRELDLLDRVCTVADADAVRSLMLHCDALLVPERTGSLRGLVLEAMAAGTLVVALDDPLVDVLEPDRTAIVVPSPTVDAWVTALRRVVAGGELAIVEAARRAIAEHHRSSDHAAALTALCERAVRGDVLPFDPA